jgi:hypothetical protein
MLRAAQQLSPIPCQRTMGRCVRAVNREEAPTQSTMKRKSAKPVGPVRLRRRMIQVRMTAIGHDVRYRYCSYYWKARESGIKKNS